MPNNLRQRLSGLYSHLENRTASVYWQARAPHVLAALNLGPTDVVLEIGCGVGTWTSYVAPRVGRMVALDVDLPAVRAARRWRSPRGRLSPTANVGFLAASAEALPFAADTFTRVLAIDVVEHVPDDRVMAAELARVLRPGGRVVLTTLTEERPTYLRRLEFPDHKREYTRTTLTRLFDGILEVERVFDFYRPPSLIARELQVIVQESPFKRLPGAGILTGLPLRLLVALDRQAPASRAAGIGVVGIKPTE
jgi:ubiquinone/menaquinone biosynthesis C-methylase UbiE